MKKHLAVVLPLLVLGCEKEPEDVDQDGIADGVREPDSVTVVAPANPKGTVSGQVLNTRREPLADVAVGMTIGSATAEAPFTAKTDGAGNFTFKGVPAGSEVLVTVGKEGYATLRASATVPSAAGNIPINNGNANLGVITLAETKSTVRFTLLTPAGRPAVGAQGYLEALPAGTISLNGTAATAVSSVIVSGQADAQGVVSFTNVPAPAELARIGETGPAAGGYRLWVDPVDVNTDGVLEAGGYAGRFDASTLMVYGGSQLIQLPAPRNDADSGAEDGGSFRVVSTNVASLSYASATTDAARAQAREPLRNMLRSGEPLFVAFSSPVQKDSLLATVTDESGRTGVSMTVTPNATWDAFSLAVPSQLPIVEGQEYNVILRATSAYSGASLSWKGYFIGGDFGRPKSTSSGFMTVAFRDSNVAGNTPNLDTGECVIVTFNQALLLPEGTGTALVEAYFDADLGFPDNRGEFGTDKGGFPALVAPAPMTAAASSSCFDEKATYPIDTTTFTYTPRFYFLFASYAATGPKPTVPVDTNVKLAFSRQVLASSVPYKTVWGVPLIDDVTVKLSKLAP